MKGLQHISSLESLEFFAKSLVEGFITGKHKSPYHGFSVEFSEHRLYNKGESTKHVDWKLFGRTDKLFVKRYEEETNLRCRIIIDSSSSMNYPQQKTLSLEDPNKLLYAVYAASSLMNLFKKQRDAVGLSLFSENVNFHSDTKVNNKHHIELKKKLSETLDNSVKEKFKKTLSVDAIHEIASRINKRSLVLVFTDLMDSQDDLSEVFTALNHLKFNKHEVILFHLIDRSTELNFNFSNMPYRFIDIESEESVDINPLDIKNEYSLKSKEFLDELKLRCLQHKIDLVNLDINQGFEQVLISYLLKRQKMF